MHHVSPKKQLQTKVRRLTLLGLTLWLAVTLAPVMAARHPDLHLWGWPVDFWMAAQGCVLAYLLLVTGFAWLVNRWERQTGESAIDVAKDQKV